MLDCHECNRLIERAENKMGRHSDYPVNVNSIVWRIHFDDQKPSARNHEHTVIEAEIFHF